MRPHGAGGREDRGDCAAGKPEPGTRHTQIMKPSPEPVDSDKFRQYLEDLGRDIDPVAGFFSPGTVFWRTSREPALLLAGMRALLLQIAHPKIAQGVADPTAAIGKTPWDVAFAPLPPSTVSCSADGMKRSNRPCVCERSMTMSMVG